VGEYAIVYCPEADDVLVLRVAHGRRDIEALFSGACCACFTKYTDTV
jgi:hypothetical protein